ncbi:type I-E CRISPR-associated protein Cas6/Cse3/CasE [Buchananella felis]|uniref:type I-E CRISPR-associated protein Cas6/Cse3/CasE n=1 Tax=Buchananella felis TaxID=3231492 RepID=UPI003527F15C
MYLTKLEIDPRRRLARKFLGSPQAMHAVVAKAAGDSGQDSEGRVLWRVDRLYSHTSLFILSPQAPDCSQIEQEAGVAGSVARTLDYRPFLDKLENGQEWSFRLTANPARAIAQGAGKRGKVTGHVTVAQQQEWLTTRAQRNGFELLAVPGVEPDSLDAAASVAHREKPVFRRAREDGGRDIVTINRTVFEGALRVTDVDAFRTVLVKGLGRSKAYGCGLLTLAKSSGS